MSTSRKNELTERMLLTFSHKNVIIHFEKKSCKVKLVFKKEMKMLNVMICEGDEVLVLANVNEMSQETFTDMIFNSLTDEEGEIFSNFAFEGIIMNDEDMKEFKGLIRECSFEDYIKELKENCVYDECED